MARRDSKPTGKRRCRRLLDISGHESISTSGSYRNYYELVASVSRVIDRKRGAHWRTQLWYRFAVSAPTALEADGWDTGLMVLSTQKAQEVVRREGLAVFYDK